MNIGQRIKQRRKELRISADKLGEAIGKDRSTIYRYEKGDIDKLPLDILVPISEVLHTTPQALMGWDDETEENPTNTDGVSDKRQALIDFAKSVPEEKADLVLRVMKSILEDN